MGDYYYCDSGALNTAFRVDSRDGSVSAVTGWRGLQLDKITDDKLAQTLNRCLRAFTVDQLKQMSGNNYLNSSVYSMNVWYQPKSTGWQNPYNTASAATTTSSSSYSDSSSTYYPASASYSGGYSGGYSDGYSGGYSGGNDYSGGGGGYSGGDY